LLNLGGDLTPEGNIFRDELEGILRKAGCKTPISLAFLLHIVYENFHKLGEIETSDSFTRFCEGINLEHMYNKMD
jgi:hypothetical protein